MKLLDIMTREEILKKYWDIQERFGGHFERSLYKEGSMPPDFAFVHRVQEEFELEEIIGSMRKHVSKDLHDLRDDFCRKQSKETPSWIVKLLALSFLLSISGLTIALIH